MEENRKMFRCEDCGAVEFEIIIEPNLPIDKSKKEWLEDCSMCPACGGYIEEV